MLLHYFKSKKNKDKVLSNKIYNEILTMCMGGVRSQSTAELLTKEGYNCINISDGFLGNAENLGWKKSGLPSK